MSVHSQRAEADRFDYALEFIRRRPLDGRLYVSLCLCDYYRLQSAAEDLYGERSRVPRFEYNSLLSRATITSFQSDLSTIVHDDVGFMIRYSATSQLKEHGFPEDVWSRVKWPSRFVRRFSKRYVTSDKVVEAGAEFYTGGISFSTPTCAVIGWTMEQYSDIQDDVRLLLYGVEYQAVIVVRIEESPQYHSPVVDEAVEFIRPDYDQERDILRAEFWDISKTSLLGPYVYGNFAWVGRIANLFLDVYKRRGKTDEPEVTRHVRTPRKCGYCAANLVVCQFIIQDGQCVKQGKINLNLTIGELAPTAEVTNSNKRSIPVTIDVDALLERVQIAMVYTGVDRFAFYCLRPESSA
ncbi:hypothetical protein POJ06DRAFT_238961 [Lipomyces tetrasporus]|uniref:Uncharacterized protein n=1 Tax=Lipomyces tetrasporus TaxID=54092 RepID=A0AAD7QSS0_9ASCO|nr:uncharacterized protein POJ06DRAFT_238961 [Lipomyces tetrasporus]KAJ8099047.1 hypothetical protein POJ06DRAFT_238961 [Lipomyces tetrasporus]